MFHFALQIIGAFVACLAFAIVLEAPKRQLPFAAAGGAVGWMIYLILEEYSGIIWATFFASLTVALISHTFARIFKGPVIVFLIPGIITMVPGAGMYRTVYQLMLGTRGQAVEYLQQTFQIAGMIALAIFIMDSLFRLKGTATANSNKK